jgi:acetoin utilization protein AcuB
MTRKHMPPMVAVMHPFPYHVDIRATLTEAADLMREHGVRHLAVMDGNVLESIISERDIERTHTPGHVGDEASLLVGDICPQRAFLADISDPLDRILDVMAEKRLGAVLVTKDGELVGIFTSVDAFNGYADMLREHFDETPGNEAA